ncbi:hypothetical protein Tco_0390025 [Tanacetum coccineum]
MVFDEARGFSNWQERTFEIMLWKVNIGILGCGGSKEHEPEVYETTEVSEQSHHIKLIEQIVYLFLLGGTIGGSGSFTSAERLRPDCKAVSSSSVMLAQKEVFVECEA